MKIIWQIDPEDIFKVNEFYGHHCQNAFVKMRMASNLKDDKAPISKEMFWELMIGCLLTTQQRSGPTSAVNRFLSTRPFSLRHEICHAQTELDQFITRTLSEFGGLRRSTQIGKEALHNSNYLENGGREQTFEILEIVRLQATHESERHAAIFIDVHFPGFGPKQSRNLLQGLGLSRFEVPIDSRITKWLNEFGFPIKLSANGLADPNYFQFVSEGFQQLSESCGIVPCLLDAAIFSSYDDGNWTAENVTW
jgi:N-glycosylase/DNA lyase